MHLAESGEIITEFENNLTFNLPYSTERDMENENPCKYLEKLKGTRKYINIKLHSFV